MINLNCQVSHMLNILIIVIVIYYFNVQNVIPDATESKRTETNVGIKPWQATALVWWA